MPDDNIPAPVTGTSGAPAATPVSDAGAQTDAGVPSPIVDPVIPTDTPATEKAAESSPETPAEVAKRIGAAHNVLIALSSDPSVDEMAAAIGLSLYLDKLGKRATAIYSGQTPNALQFLKPEETFENSVDTLQDFVIALNKEKADHLRYKLDGEYVKIFITPYKSRIAEEDLEFSYGDYNVDLVLALDVANGVDLDSALREHGRIMHDAVIIDITTGNPGKLGEIEWSDKSASSVSEMIAKLLYGVNSKAKIEKEEATAFLTGIVAATNRFANGKTTSETMRLSSKLIDSGANQQLISKNITPDIENEMLSMGSLDVSDGSKTVSNGDPTLLDIQHGNEEDVDETKVVDDVVTEKESTLLDDLKAAEASLASAGAEVMEEESKEPLQIDSSEASMPAEGAAGDGDAQVAEVDASEVGAGGDGAVAEAEAIPEPVAGEEVAATGEPGGNDEPSGAAVEGAPVLPEVNIDGGEKKEETTGDAEGFVKSQPEKVIQPSSDFENGLGGVDNNKYGHMLEDALASANGVMEPAMPAMPAPGAAPVGGAGGMNPAAMGAPAVPASPEINGVPEINYMPMPGDAVLPPPPTPPIADEGSVPPVADTAVLPAVEPAPVVEPVQPAASAMEPTAQAPAVDAPASDPGAFKIPGM